MSRFLSIIKQTGRPILRQQLRKFSASSGSLEEKFRTALDNLNKLKEDPGNEAKLKLYAFYKQATVGPCDKPKPSVFNIVDKAKWEAWNSLGQLSKTEAMQKYTETVGTLMKEAGTDSGDGSSAQPNILVENKNGVCWIQYNRPNKYNAISYDMYTGIIDALQSADRDESIKFALMTGKGQYYSSGNDLRNFEQLAAQYKDNLRAGAEESAKILQKFVAAFIDFSKPLIAAVNGPAIGVAMTTLGLMDCVIASDTATFQCPFSALGQAPEGCSTYTFPMIMGYSMASQMLYFNYKMNAKEAEACGLVARVVPAAQFHDHLNEWLYGNNGLVKTCYPKSMMTSKLLVRNEEIQQKLHQVNKVECETIIDRWLSDECAEALQKFYTRKSNL